MSTGERAAGGLEALQRRLSLYADGYGNADRKAVARMVAEWLAPHIAAAKEREAALRKAKATFHVLKQLPLGEFYMGECEQRYNELAMLLGERAGGK